MKILENKVEDVKEKNRIRCREYYKKNLESERKRKNNYYRENKNLILGEKKQKRLENVESIRIKEREYYKRNRKSILKRKIDYNRKNNYKYYKKYIENNKEYQRKMKIRDKTKSYFSLKDKECERCGKKAEVRHHNTIP